MAKQTGPADRKQLHAEIAAFLLGKRITGVRFTDPELSERDDSLELIFDDGSEIELYAFALDDAGELLGGHAEMLFALVAIASTRSETEEEHAVEP